MKNIIEKITLLTTCTIMFAGCNRADMYMGDNDQHTVSEMRVTINSFAESISTRTLENSYQTSFSGNERIGVFAIKTSGNVILNNNIPYRYNISTDSWAPEDPANKAYVYGSDVTYYAYYPYSNGMDGMKSVTEIIAAFTPLENQSSYNDYTASDLMTGTGTLSSNNLTFTFTHALSLIEIEITENSNVSITPNPVFYNMMPWRMPDGKYRYIVRPGTATEVAFEYGPEDNRHAYRKILSAADVINGNYTKVKATFDNINMELNTGNYIGSLGTPSKVTIDGKDYTLTPGSNNNKYIINKRRTLDTPITSFKIYIQDNLASTEQMLLSVTPALIAVDATAKTVTLPLNANGMEGAGTLADPYLVTTPPQMRGIAQNKSSYYKQMVDIDLSVYTNWSPSDISGVYDGNHQGISNLNFSGGSGGLFMTNSGTIKNTHILSGIVKGNGAIGGICATLRGSSAVVENCSNAATIEGTNDNGAGTYIGGICGQVEENCIVRHCRNDGVITGKAEIMGGITGWISRGSVSYCYNRGTVTPTKPYHPDKSAGYGGIAGAIYYSNPTLSYCHNIGTIAVNNWPGSGRGSAMRGEVVGWTENGKGVQHNWYKEGDTPVGDNGSNASDNNKFDDAANRWPVYSTGTSDGWGDSHWKSFSQGVYPQLLWE